MAGTGVQGSAFDLGDPAAIAAAERALEAAAKVAGCQQGDASAVVEGARQLEECLVKCLGGAGDAGEGARRGRRAGRGRSGVGMGLGLRPGMGSGWLMLCA